MLRLLPDHVVLLMTPAAVSVTRFAPGWRRRIVRNLTLECEAGLPLWKSAMDATRTLFALPEWQGGKLSVQLSNHFVHYVITPENGDLKTSEERRGFLGILFEQIYGRASGEWDLRESPAKKGEATLACGVDRHLLSELRSLASPNRLTQVRPCLMDEINRLRKRLNNNLDAIVFVEPGRITLVLLVKGKWTSVVSRAMAHPDGSVARQMLEEQCALAGLEARGKLWLHDLTGQCAWPNGSGWELPSLVAPKKTVDHAIMHRFFRARQA